MLNLRKIYIESPRNKGTTFHTHLAVFFVRTPDHLFNKATEVLLFMLVSIWFFRIFMSIYLLFIQDNVYGQD